jgi:hypothetical protein
MESSDVFKSFTYHILLAKLLKREQSAKGKAVFNHFTLFSSPTARRLGGGW